MSWTALICLGASDGPRIENLLLSAAQLLSEFDGTADPSALCACSELYGDRHRVHRGGATVNLMLAMKVAPRWSVETMERRFKQIEAAFGRERDPQRVLPVPLDIDLVGRIDGEVQWQDRYDPARPYLFHGLHQLTLPLLRKALDAVALQRGFRPEHNAMGFYPLAGADFVERFLHAQAATPATAAKEAS
ncbi:2-amino-4-hydroxy-6-hydroxymethyldihydropteridine diphosphokinase [Lysobacter antibioticus]|jgi:7,8-dihydro-6-hydroxymethylpterin-pyrophosphokinase|uniref:6-hydroxymethyl-7,8-dihydropterin pyrophosphokinase n=1 Tax=Lysobacter antibioticus TaxID=84531 RepID=A0A0S2F9Z5_LYSAN|nr:2-amino-4-hydroxy-6-hydroxymethyldihydropteridine diphosphokinase [Lysobacter antibioticus]ALN80366.1 hypothetical protein LA76x_2231 [Lysobacter antibioticus]